MLYTYSKLTTLTVIIIIRKIEKYWKRHTCYSDVGDDEKNAIYTITAVALMYVKGN